MPGHGPSTVCGNLAARGPLPAVEMPVITANPRLRKQLVLELEVREVVAEGVKSLPGGVIVGEAMPLDQELPGATTLLRPQHTLGCRKHTAIKRRWKIAECSRRVTAVLLQKTHMEDVVDAGALWKL